MFGDRGPDKPRPGAIGFRSGCRGWNWTPPENRETLSLSEMRMTVRTIVVELATTADAAAVGAVRRAAADKLTTDFGAGTWSLSSDSDYGLRNEILYATVLVARDDAKIVGTLK